MEKEMWKPVVGYEGYYEVSNLGRIKSLPRKYVKAEKFIKPKPDRIGYLIVSLNKEAYQKEQFIHRLVAKAFIPNPENKKEVNHIDANKGNNRLDNLEWVTHKENIRHAYKLNLVPPLRGGKNGMSYLSEKDVEEIRKSTGVLRITAEKYNTTKSTVWNIRNGVTWKLQD